MRRPTLPNPPITLQMLLYFAYCEPSVNVEPDYIQTMMVQWNCDDAFQAIHLLLCGGEHLEKLADGLNIASSEATGMDQMGVSLVVISKWASRLSAPHSQGDYLLMTLIPPTKLERSLLGGMTARTCYDSSDLSKRMNLLCLSLRLPCW
jgi:hypothetical protein